MAERELDNIYQRKKYKDAQFGDKRTTRDEYTSDRIYYGNHKNAKKKYSTGKIADVDHIRPIKVIDKKYPELSLEQKRVLANKTYNQAITNAKLNRSKGGVENHQYIMRETKKAFVNLSEGNYINAEQQIVKIKKEAPGMLKKELESKARMSVDVTKMRADNMKSGVKEFGKNVCCEGFEGANLAIRANLVPILGNVVKNTISIASEEKDLDEAARDIGKFVLEIGAAGAVTKVAEKTLEKAAAKATSEHIKKILSPEVVGTTIAIAASVSNYVVAYADGTMDEKQLLENIFFDGCLYFVQDSFIEILGAGLSSGGAIIGLMIISAACSYIIDIYRSFNDYKKDISYISKIINDAGNQISEIEKQLKDLCENELKKLGEHTKKGYDMILRAALQNDYIKAEEGMNCILSTVNEKVVFSGLSRNEFRKQLFDKQVGGEIC